MTAGRTVNSSSHHWGTPHHYIEAVLEVFDYKISLDPCSNKYSVVNADTEYQLPEVDGLHARWDFPTIYVNPPYGADRERGTTIRDWLKRCAESHHKYGSQVIALVPVATNTLHWKRYIWSQAAAVAFLYDTRLKFLVDGLNGGKGAPMSCAMIYWGKDMPRFLDVFSEYGAVIDLSTAKVSKYEKTRNPRQTNLLNN
ncbi:MAG: DNA N-6-adenine-methyltransferase [Candidatus Lernaella stagnicola]|nr:DNA N-6-adenine-methyltransferase [Candidatus Lernaella stagnicola]